MARRAAVDFYPCVMEAYGRMGQSTLALVRRLSARAALDRGVGAAAEFRRWCELLGARLALDQAGILLDT